jgi:hypothetical protein
MVIFTEYSGAPTLSITWNECCAAGAWRFRVWQKVDNRLGRFSLVRSIRLRRGPEKPEGLVVRA